MRPSEIRALRSLYAHKHLMNFLNSQTLNPPIYHRRLFHSTNHLAKSANVSTYYDPNTSRIVTKRASSKDGSVSGDDTATNTSVNGGFSSSSYYQDALRDDNRTYGSVSNVQNQFPGREDGRTYGGVSKLQNQAVSGFKGGAGKKKGKVKMSWMCEECGYSDGQWWGICRECQRAGTMVPISESSEDAGGNKRGSGFAVTESIVRSWLAPKSGEPVPLRLNDVNKGLSQTNWRIPLYGSFGNEVSRVLGGGVVPGSLVLVGGDPGVGKSTLLLQIAALIADSHNVERPGPVVYVSGEESVEQIGNRAERLKIETEELFLYSNTDIEDILEKCQSLSPGENTVPRAIVVDSIQTVYLKGVAGSAGSVVQVKECASALLRFAKKTNIPVFMIGHVTKTGDIAGPRVLEHLVDAVLYMEGEKSSSHRLLRSIKNRFGSTDELGVFEMAPSGLQAVSNPCEIFLSDQYQDSEVLAGKAVAVVMDGSRSFVLEIQALCVAGTAFSRQVNGVQSSRADMIVAVLMKQAGLKLQANAIFLNVVSGVTLTETAGDLAVAAAICSSFLEFPIPNGVAFVGEIGLGGELRMVPGIEKRVNTVAKMGYTKCIVPKSAEQFLLELDLGETEVVGCKNLKEVINTVFVPQ